MEINRTSLSVGLILYSLLSGDEAVSSIASQVFPVAVSQEARLPYVTFRTAKTEQLPVKDPRHPDDMVEVEILACGESYEESVELAEAVRAAIDNQRATVDGMTMRSCMMTGRQEMWEDDAYIQAMIFKIRV